MDKRQLSRILLTLILLTAFGTVHAYADHGHTLPKKVGILLVAFGSSEDSAQVSFENIEKQVETAFPDIPVRLAYTCHIIRAKLA
jgi:sirohydrochlorin cobaltochelatase